MYSKKTVLINKSGLHARPGTVFTREAKKFESNIAITKLDENDKPIKSANAKSIALVMALMLPKGTHVEIGAEGPDETAAVDALIALCESGMGDV